MNIPFAHPKLLFVLLALPALAVLALWSRRRRRQALARFGGQVRRLRPLGRRVRNLSLMFGLVCLGVGLAGPQWGRDWDQSTAPGRDLMVVVDCSWSMFAETPSRLERARTALLDLATTMRQRGGHRLGLVLFAGKAKLVCPLTHDYDHFRDTVAAIDLDGPDTDLKPDSKDRSGTRIGRGLTLAVKAHDPRFQGARDILLLSDGDDPARDGEWAEGAREAYKEGIPVHIVAIGDPNQGHPIPQGREWRRDENEDRLVRTRLEEAPLREVARITGGEMTVAGTRPISLGAHYLGLVAGQPVRGENVDALPVYRQRYVWFLLPAFVLLAVPLLLPEGGSLTIRNGGRP
jgi:Ca-activated chloride channel family protein